jgi:hypothetical protein
MTNWSISTDNGVTWHGLDETSESPFSSNGDLLAEIKAEYGVYKIHPIVYQGLVEGVFKPIEPGPDNTVCEVWEETDAGLRLTGAIITCEGGFWIWNKYNDKFSSKTIRRSIDHLIQLNEDRLKAHYESLQVV